ncbi:YqaJ viral recombinase family protein [Agromyces binzhouensis]|uniref:Recombinase n=1 Tax=Agromyces binzhouensis TaxID=1817495 RepID=A0A4Q2JJZ5_9MICO|nr:recombinase [Agromyces binzhouensis]
MTDTPFALFDLESVAPRVASALRQPPLPHETRIVADSGDRVAWLRARARGVTATDAAKLASESSVRAAANEKLHDGRSRGFGGSRYTDHGREREPVIARWARAEHGIAPSSLLFHAESDRRHLATPDGLKVLGDGTLELCEIKTTSKPWRGIPRGYLRQVWWQQYVLGAERTLVVWEQHDGFVPIGDPQCRWVDRDEDQIAQLVRLAGMLLEAIRPQSPGEPARVGGGADRSFYRPGPLA